MKYEQVVSHYGSLTKAAQALGLKRQTVHVWGVRQRIPWPWQIKIERLTRKLKADGQARREARKYGLLNGNK